MGATVKNSFTIGGGQAWVVADGQGARWRMWGSYGPEWTSDRDQALHFARRADAEAFANDDEDAWLIQPVGMPAQAVDLGQEQDAIRWRWLIENRPVLLITGFFGNGCVNRSMAEVEALIDSHAGREPNSERNRLTAGMAASDTRPCEFRDALLWAEDAADCSSHPDHKAYRFALSELLSMIGSEEAEI
ncbi:MAG: hypothetical protein RR778_15775 [Glutamicibacter sp.]|uniref:hypothetical protein n=1 Tax=Glutamicibacter sp. TaxID=1931995 RepID=UPI002FC8A1D6